MGSARSGDELDGGRVWDRDDAHESGSGKQVIGGAIL